MGAGCDVDPADEDAAVGAGAKSHPGPSVRRDDRFRNAAVTIVSETPTSRTRTADDAPGFGIDRPLGQHHSVSSR